MAAIGKKMILGREAHSLGAFRIKSKPFPSSFSSSNGILLKANLQAPSINGAPSPSINSNQTNLKMACEEQLELLGRREREHGMLADAFTLGTVVKDKRIFSQDFTIRSYDMGPNHTATVETLMNLIQETALNHMRSMGLLRDGFGATQEMNGRNLIWVLSKMHVVVDRYPSWNDDVRVDTWFVPSSKNGYGIEWIMYDRRTEQTLTRASSLLMMMNKETRKLSKIPEGVRREMEPQYIDGPPILDEDSSRLPKLDYNKMEYVRTGLTPRWNDLDANHHVNNVKYVGLMLKSVPISFLESHELSAINVEYRRECAMGDVLQSLTSVCQETIDGSIGSGDGDECLHFLCFESGAVVARGRTKWRPKHAKN